jgi:hypothetical protein
MAQDVSTIYVLRFLDEPDKISGRRWQHSNVVQSLVSAHLRAESIFASRSAFGFFCGADAFGLGVDTLLSQQRSCVI